MEPSRSYYTDDQLGQRVYRCVLCPFDTFEESRIVTHAAQHGVYLLPDMDLDLMDWVDRERKASHLAGTHLTIGFITWNTREASILGAKAIVAEIQRLAEFGITAEYCWVDNGSSDGTVEALTAVFNDVPGANIPYTVNMGQSIARNVFIDYARCKSDYLMMVDGDVEIIPYSAYAMMMFLASRTDNMACVGMASYNCTNIPGDGVPRSCRKIDHQMVQLGPRIAWTNYGMFKVGMFHDGIRFDESPAFCGDGWGLEDNELYLQMAEKGYESCNTTHFRFYHRNRNSSIPIMGRDTAMRVLEERRQYVIRKWRGVPSAKWYVDTLLGLSKVDFPPPRRHNPAATV